MLVGDALFFENDLDSYLRAQKGAVEAHVRKHVTKQELSKSSDEEIVSRLLPEAYVAPLEVDFDQPVKDVKEVRVQVSDMFSGMVEIDGVRATRSFAFTGERRLFELRTNPWSSSLPHGSVRGSRIIIGMEGRRDAETLKREIDRQEQLLREYVGYSAKQVNEHNQQLERLLKEAVARRRKQLDEIDDLKNSI